jgi:hypothetical protein
LTVNGHAFVVCTLGLSIKYLPSTLRHKRGIQGRMSKAKGGTDRPHQRSFPRAPLIAAHPARFACPFIHSQHSRHSDDGRKPQRRTNPVPFRPGAILLPDSDAGAALVICAQIRQATWPRREILCSRLARNPCLTMEQRHFLFPFGTYDGGQLQDFHAKANRPLHISV